MMSLGIWNGVGVDESDLSENREEFESVAAVVVSTWSYGGNVVVLTSHRCR